MLDSGIDKRGGKSDVGWGMGALVNEMTSVVAKNKEVVGVGGEVVAEAFEGGCGWMGEG